MLHRSKNRVLFVVVLRCSKVERVTDGLLVAGWCGNWSNALKIKGVTV